MCQHRVKFVDRAGPPGFRLDVEAFRRHPGGAAGNLSVGDVVCKRLDHLQKRALHYLCRAAEAPWF